jgi:hypothetical protein
MADQHGPLLVVPWREATKLVADMEHELASAKTTLASLENKVAEFKALVAAPSTMSRSQQTLQSPEPEEGAAEEEEVEVEEVEECAVCENEIRPDLVIDLGTKYQGNSVVVCKLCYYYSFFRDVDTLCPRTRVPLNKKVIETLPQNKQGYPKFSPTRGIAKGCNVCKYPKDGRGCKYCMLPYNGHGVA